MKNQIKLVVLLLLALPVFTSCIKNEIAGPMTTQTRTLNPYNELEIRGDFDVQISEGADFDIQITAPDNVLPYIESDVANDHLVISESQNRIKDSQITITLSNTYLERIELTGSGRIQGDSITASNTEIILSGSGIIELSLNCDVSDIHLSGSGRINLFGTSPKVNYDLSGSGSISANAMDCQTANAQLSGSGNIQLFASDSLYANISGSGSILYWGDPQFMSTHITGSGSIIHQ